MANAYDIKNSAISTVEDFEADLTDGTKHIKDLILNLLERLAEAEWERDDNLTRFEEAQDAKEDAEADYNFVNEQLTKVGDTVRLIALGINAGMVAGAIADLNDLIKLLDLECEYASLPVAH